MYVTYEDRDLVTATTLNNLAYHYKCQGSYEDAKAMYTEALNIRRSECKGWASPVLHLNISVDVLQDLAASFSYPSLSVTW